MPIFGAGDRIGAGVRYSQGGSSGFGAGSLSTPDLFGAGNSPAAGWQPDDSQLAVSSKFVPLLYSLLELAGGGILGRCAIQPKAS